MDKKYDLSNLAKADLKDIWYYTEERWSEQQANRYYHDIIQTIEQLASGELQGGPANIRDGYQKQITGRHFIFYYDAEGRILVIRVLRQSMDVERHL